MNPLKTSARPSKSVRRTRLDVQILEDRCTPAAVTVPYTDIDGDLVKITASKPGSVAPPLSMANLTISGMADPHLLKLDLTDPGFEDAKIVISAAKVTGGDGLAHVGFIDATDRDLSQVIVDGDLGKIVVGDPSTAADPGLNLLRVNSLGGKGHSASSFDIYSTVWGKLGALRVAGDFDGVELAVQGGDFGRVGSVRIDGSIVGGAKLKSGRLFAHGDIGAVRVGGSVNGGDGNYSGSIYSLGGIGPVRIGGDLGGGLGVQSGHIYSKDTMGDLRIGGNVAGSAGHASGSVYTESGMGNVRIGGSLIGDQGDSSGAVVGRMKNVRIGGDVRGGAGGLSGLINAGELGKVFIGGDVIGGNVGGTNNLYFSGAIHGGRIPSVTIVGSLISGFNTGTGILSGSGAIHAHYDIGPIRIGGSIVGNETNPVTIWSLGQPFKPTTGYDVAIASLSVKGDVTHLKMLAGFDLQLLSANGDASVGAVTIGGDWTASSVVAGVWNTGPDDTTNDDDNLTFGDGNDWIEPSMDTPLVARIASITIRGRIIGTASDGDHFGFVAQEIGKLKIGKTNAPLLAGASNDSFVVPFTFDVSLVEVG